MTVINSPEVEEGPIFLLLVHHLFFRVPDSLGWDDGTAEGMKYKTKSTKKRHEPT